jgi:RNA-directed DNA polymerase
VQDGVASASGGQSAGGTGVRAAIVASKRGNARGAKGRRKVDDVTDRPTPERLASVPRATGAKQAEEIRARWAWTEATVWTARMLTALERGVQGDVWFSLIDKVWSPRNLLAAFTKVKANGGAAGVDHQTVARFAKHLEENLGHLSEVLRTGTYRPQAIRRVYIPKPGSTEKRPLGIPTVRDRVAQTALRNVLEPIFERGFAEHSYGFRPNRGAKDALRRVNALLKAGYRYVVDADLQHYFDSIPHDRLMERIQTQIADGRVLALIKTFLTQGVLEGLEHWQPTSGSPQGSPLSPLLSNIYLDALDQRMAQAHQEMVRYADDFVILCRTRAAAETALQQVQAWTAAAGLALHPSKTRIVDFEERGGFDFLGYHFERDRRHPGEVWRWPRAKSIQRLKANLREKTPRDHGHSLAVIIARLNGTLRGWFNYFQHTNVNTVFPRLDGWVRHRLRRILLQRAKKRRRNGLGWAHVRWQNAFFAEHGLLSLATAHAQAGQSVRR